MFLTMPAVYPPDLTISAGVDQMFDNDAGDKVAQVGRAQKAGIVNSVEYIPNWNLTGANTNTRTLVLLNRRTNGLGTTTVATLALVSGVSLTRGVAVSMSISAAGNVLAAGDVLEWQSLRSGTGLPDPGGRVVVQHSLGT